MTGCYEALKHGKGKFLHSVVKEAREFAREMELDLETEFDREMKNTENARKLARIAKENGKKAIDTAWKSKSLHSKYPLQSEKVGADLNDTHQSVRSSGLKAETEGFIIIAQGQSLFTRNFRLIFFIMELTLGVDSVIQAPIPLTTSCQSALSCPK